MTRSLLLCLLAFLTGCGMEDWKYYGNCTNGRIELVPSGGVFGGTHRVLHCDEGDHAGVTPPRIPKHCVELWRDSWDGDWKFKKCR